MWRELHKRCSGLIVFDRVLSGAHFFCWLSQEVCFFVPLFVVKAIVINGGYSTSGLLRDHGEIQEQGDYVKPPRKEMVESRGAAAAVVCRPELGGIQLEKV